MSDPVNQGPESEFRGHLTGWQTISGCCEE